MNSRQFNVCRAVRASSSFSFLEVIVSCEVTGRDQTLSCNADDDKVGKTFYLHLKRFFRGARFTWQPFLNSIQEKHRPGDFVCVSGKVSLSSSLTLALYELVMPYVVYLFVILLHKSLALSL